MYYYLAKLSPFNFGSKSYKVKFKVCLNINNLNYLIINWTLTVNIGFSLYIFNILSKHVWFNLLNFNNNIFSKCVKYINGKLKSIDKNYSLTTFPIFIFKKNIIITIIQLLKSNFKKNLRKYFTCRVELMWRMLINCSFSLRTGFWYCYCFRFQNNNR